MNNFFVYSKQNDIWEKVDGVSVFPFNYGKLLDEKLNEAYLVITKSQVKSYKPTTEIRIDLIESAKTDQEKTTSQYYIVARDNAIERPVGSGLYRHEIYLIERTKLLEGIVCQSITFTNTKGALYSNSASEVINNNVFGGDNIYALEGYFSNITFEKYVSPLLINSTIDTVPMQSVIDEITNNFNRADIVVSVENEKENKVLIKNGNTTSEYLAEGDYSKTYNIEIKNTNLSITYDIYLELLVYDSHFFPSVRITYNFIAIENHYPLKPYTVKDCVDRVLELAEPLYQGETPKYHIDPLQAAELDKIYAPEFTMTQCNLREQLKVIGGYIHAEPRLLGGDDEITLGDGTTVTRDRIIRFDYLGGGEQAKVKDPYVFNQYTYDINEYCTSVDSTASNIVNALDYAQGVIYTPNVGNYRTIRTESVNTRVLESNGFVSTQFPIHAVVKVMCGVFQKDGQGWAIEPVDITPYVFEETEYFSNLSSYGGGYPNSKSYAIYYSIGQKNLQGLFFKAESVWGQALAYYSIVNILSATTGKNQNEIRGILAGGILEEDSQLSYTANLAFQVSYIPIYKTRFSHGKGQTEETPTEYTRIYNQSENIIETRYYGENVKGAAARLGNVDQTRTYRFNNLSDVPEIGQMIDDYAISAVNVSFMPTDHRGIKCTVALTKDFNRISQYIGISSQKRVYEVSERAAYARDILLKEYVVVGTAKKYETGIFKSSPGIRSIFEKDPQGGYEKQCVSAVLSCRIDSDGNRHNETLLPVISSAFGNTMTFSWSYKDNYSAGARVDYKTSGSVSGFWQEDVPYGDYFGRIQNYWFSMLYGQQIENTNIFLETITKDIAMSLPSWPQYAKKPYAIGTNIIGKPYIMKKDSREIVNMNVSIEFKSNMKSLTIGSAMAGLCGLVFDAGDDWEKFVPKLYRLDTPIRKFQAKILELPMPANENGFSMQRDYNYDALYITIPQEYKTATAFAICTPISTETTIYEDEDGKTYEGSKITGGDVLLSCNDPAAFFEENPSGKIYFNFARKIN